MKRSFRWFVILTLVVGLTLAACAPKGSAAPTPAPAPEKPGAAAPVTPRPAPAGEQALLEAAKKEGQVVFWTMSLAEAERVFAPFKAKYPFLKVSHWDAPGGDDVAARMIEEAKAGRHSVDVLILSETYFPDLLDKNMLQVYDWPNVQGWRNPSESTLLRNIGMSLRAPMYNTDLVKGADIPVGWNSINDAKWRGRAFASTSAYEVPLLFAYQWRNKQTGELAWDKAFKFFTEVMEKTKPRVGRGFTSPTQWLTAGEISIMLINSLNTGVRNIRLGAPVDIAAVEFVPGAPWSIALVKDAPHPNAAKLLADWLTSDDGNLHYSELQQFSSLNPRVYAKQMVGQMFESRRMEIVYAPPSVYSPANSRKTYDFWLDLLERK